MRWRGGGRLQVLLRAILPALEGIDARLPAEAQMRLAVEANVRWAMRQLAETPGGQPALAEPRATMAGAVYEMRRGRERFLSR